MSSPAFTSPALAGQSPQAYVQAIGLTQYWDVNTLSWVKGTQPGGGAGGPVTIADGDDFAQGSVSDAAWVAGDGTVISLLKAIAAPSGGGLTDAELRASPLDVLGPLTDAELRAVAVPVSGTFFQATQPVSAAALPLPSGAATLAAQTQPGVDIGDVTVNNAAGAAAVNIQDGGNVITVDGTVAVTSAGLTNLDVALSTRLKPADTLTGVTTVGTVTTITNPVAVTGPVTDAQLRAVPVPVSGTVAATQSATWTVQPGNTANTTAWLTSTKVALTAASPVAVSVGVASAQAVASNANRKGLILTNTSNARISLGIGVAAVLDSGVTLYPGGVAVMDEFWFATGAVNAIASAAASNLGVQEFS